jgi:hypothetical protein
MKNIKDRNFSNTGGFPNTLNNLHIIYSQDDTLSQDEENLSTNYLKKQQLMHLENDRSLTIDSDYENNMSMSKNEEIIKKDEYQKMFTQKNQNFINNLNLNNNFTNNKEKINRHDELLRVISDTSGKNLLF